MDRYQNPYAARGNLAHMRIGITEASRSIAGAERGSIISA